MPSRDAPPIGLAHFTFLDLDPGALIALAAETGFAAVGLRLWPVTPDGVCYPLPEGSDALRRVRRLMAETGVSVYDAEAVVIEPGFDAAALAPTIASAAALGATRLNVAGADPDRARLTAGFAALCELAAPAGIAVDLECMAWRSINSLGACREVVEAAGQPNGGILVDALHLARCGGVPADVAALPEALVRSVQLCDAPATAPEGIEAQIAEARGRRLIPGDGGLPLKALISAVPAGAAFSVELPMEDSAPPADRARRILAATRRLFADA